MALGVPYSESVVIKNAIDPIEHHEKPKDKINLIYHTTPHRGLDILYAVYEQLAKNRDDIHLDVYSSFNVYGWPQRDVEFKPLFDKLEAHPNITYHGAVPNSEVREALKKAHIFAYPCTWVETSCISAIEAMSAGCAVVCPNLGALPETTSNFGIMYPFDEDINEAEKLKSEAEETLREYEEKIQSASKEAGEIINQAKTKADEMIDNIKKQQDLKLSQMLSDSKDRINKQYEDSKDQIENAKVESIKLISAKFLTESLDDEDILKEIN